MKERSYGDTAGDWTTVALVMACAKEVDENSVLESTLDHEAAKPALTKKNEDFRCTSTASSQRQYVKGQ